MVATVEDIERWFDRGVEEEQKWMLVVCDTFDHEDYPSFHNDEDKCKAAIDRLRGGKDSMQSLMEVYDLEIDKDMQLEQHRVFNGPA